MAAADDHPVPYANQREDGPHLRDLLAPQADWIEAPPLRCLAGEVPHRWAAERSLRRRTMPRRRLKWKGWVS